ncbi:uncharacterized protein SETTUDRAFT_100000 [Exserohilum turcica Et28A]|uniref:Fungal N-terminal domain-containing protein n=1 Tax=Exserohilum turcicum (strain 28A) TaxID=671987 RepID=R0I5V7_EXST2|nr:uncharacterized protein SETTUDRAFT_100000 [Exserohilum turcica Et28A]EOA80936.1 hypothetical protein SETTUDRAFT_100000 [Exserohilum turcica Et28A]
MAVLAAILPVVSRSSALALGLFRIAAESPEAAQELVAVANKINAFASILKQVGTIIKEDDRLPSPEAVDALDDVIEQSQHVLTSFESATSIEGTQHHGRRDSASSVGSTGSQPDPSTKTRLAYLMAHLEALSTTLSVLLQTLYTAQSIMWSKLRPTVSPQQAARVVDHEKTQLETLIIQQQLAILFALTIFETSSKSDARTMEEESPQSLISTDKDQTPKPSNLYPYHNKELFNLDTSGSNGLPSVCKISASQAEHLLHQWTSLRQFERRLEDEEHEQRRQRQQAQQATVESDSEEDHSKRSKKLGDGVWRSRRSPSVQPLFTAKNMPSPESEKQFGPQAPRTPADTPHTPQTSISTTSSSGNSSGGPPVDAAAAVEAKEDAIEADLEIPWRLCTRKYHWRFIDAKQVDSNTDQPPSVAFAERNSWTEIMASWVCKEAIQEARLPFTQVQKEKQDGRRTTFETCFCIARPLQFDQVNRLVERTVEIYRENAPPTPPAQPKARSSSFHQPSVSGKKGNHFDQTRTPVTRATHPPLDRAKRLAPGGLPSGGLAPPGVPPPPLDRSKSTPGPGLVPPLPQTAINSRTPNLQIPVPTGQHYSHHAPTLSHSPRHAYYSQQASGYPTQPMQASAPPYYPHPHIPSSASTPATIPPPPPPSRHYYNTDTNTETDTDTDTPTSDSEPSRPHRTRRSAERSRSRYADRYADRPAPRRSYETRRKKKKKASAGALLGVGGLTALLDGLGGL